MKRRDFLKLAGLAGVALWAPGLMAGERAAGRRTLVLLELGGGNDGLNTVIPFRDDAYHRARPSLGVPSGQVLKLDRHDVGLNPALGGLHRIWGEGELAVIEGLGYPSPNRSHFRSIEIWETASSSDQTLDEGWLAAALRGQVQKGDAAAGIILGQQGQTGELAGEVSSLVMRNPEEFIKAARRLKPARVERANPALAHVLSVQGDLLHGASVLEQTLSRGPAPRGDFGRDPFGRQLREAARLILAGVPVAAIKVSLVGFDTHARQRGGHERLLGMLGDGLSALREALVAGGAWDRTLVVTCSEFGRRVQENGSEGTDHGTAAAHFALGGRVKGGLYGQRPSLTDLDEGDLRHTTDFRRLLATAGRAWLGLPAKGLGPHKPLGLLR